MRAASPEAYRLLHEGSQALAQVEANGIRVDTGYLKKAMAWTAEEIASTEAELTGSDFFKDWRERFGSKTKLGNKAQLAELVFTPIKKGGVYGYPYPHEELTKRGDFKGDAEAFSHIPLPFVDRYRYLEKIKKARNTFLKGIATETIGGYMHAVFNLHLVISYRSSSDTPNFQNFPVRDPEVAGLIRNCFVARKGYHLVEIDYGGIEVKVAACYNHDPNLIAYILNPDSDMHADTAVELFLSDRKTITKKHPLRHVAKNMFVFPEFYGSWFYQCALDIWGELSRRSDIEIGGIPALEYLETQGIRGLGEKTNDPKWRPKAGEFLDRVRQVEHSFWRERFGVYTQWKKELWNNYQRTGSIKTLTGFLLQGIMGKNDAINYPIQGSAFHCLLWSLIRIQKELKRRKMKTRIVGQIHDSIIADVHRKELHDYVALCQRIMLEDILKYYSWICVPLEVEVEVAPLDGTWHDKKKWELN